MTDPIPTAADIRAAIAARDRAVARFMADPPPAGSLGAIGLMVEECAVEIARARLQSSTEPTG